MKCFGCKRELKASQMMPQRLFRSGAKVRVCSWCKPLEEAKARRRKKHRASRLDQIVREA